MYGAPGRIRTSDRSVRSRVLYPAELQAHILRGTQLSRFLDATSIIMAEKEGLLRASCPPPFGSSAKVVDVKNRSRRFFRTRVLTKSACSSIFLKMNQKKLVHF